MIQAFGKYMVMLYSIFLKPEKFSIYWKRFVDEIIQLGLKSLFIVILMSGFMGAVLVIQTASVIESAWRIEISLCRKQLGCQKKKEKITIICFIPLLNFSTISALLFFLHLISIEY